MKLSEAQNLRRYRELADWFRNLTDREISDYEKALSLRRAALSKGSREP